MTASERTPLLGRSESQDTEEWEEPTAGSIEDHEVFALWQLGAFFGM